MSSRVWPCRAHPNLASACWVCILCVCGVVPLLSHPVEARERESTLLSSFSEKGLLAWGRTCAYATIEPCRCARSVET